MRAWCRLPPGEERSLLDPSARLRPRRLGRPLVSSGAGGLASGSVIVAVLISRRCRFLPMQDLGNQTGVDVPPSKRIVDEESSMEGGGMDDAGDDELTEGAFHAGD